MSEWPQSTRPFGYDDVVDAENVVTALYLFPDTPVHPAQLKDIWSSEYVFAHETQL